MELGKRQLTSREEVKFMSEYNVVMSTAESTVVTEYEPQQTRSDAYQSEAALENAFIKMLTEQGYQYLKIDSPSALIDNLRHQLEKLNILKTKLQILTKVLLKKQEKFKRIIFKFYAVMTVLPKTFI